MIDDITIAGLPDSSGVYIFRDKEGKIIYVGKAKSLKDRVRSYAGAGARDPKTARLVGRICTVETILTTSETEAFLLENNLIKEHSPRYNVNLKDDKTYISLKLTVNERFPALYITRKIENDGAVYFGPYASAGDIRDVIRLAQEFYPVRRCKNTIFRKRKRACMLHQIGKCMAPCMGAVDEARYGAVVRELKDLLSGKTDSVLAELQRRIGRAADAWDFEEAQRLKTLYGNVERLADRQRVHEHFGKDRDVWAFEGEEKGFRAVLLRFRRGVLVSKKTFSEATPLEAWRESLGTFLFQYYASRDVPDELVLSEDIGDAEGLARYLKEKRRAPCRICGPGTRRAREMVPLAAENLKAGAAPDKATQFLKALQLKKKPRRIEVYDISHTHGTNPTGVMVVFEEGRAARDQYRVFHIREAAPMDDTAMMAEVLRRRLTNSEMRPLPDLIVLDGGKGQLSAVTRVMRGLGVGMDVIGIAKGERRKKLEDLVYLPGRKNPLVFGRASQVLKDLGKMRDEAHRFAISSHKRWKRRDDLA